MREVPLSISEYDFVIKALSENLVRVVFMKALFYIGCDFLPYF
jgi:hypothetical protein